MLGASRENQKGTSVIKTKETTRVYFFDMLKIISCFAVIILHVAALQFDQYAPTTFEWNVFNFFDSCVRFAVPVFVMVSGALFLNGEKEIDIRKLYKKNILRLLTAYLFFTVLYAIYTFYTTNGFIHVKEIMKNSILSSHYHLWYIPMLIGIYMCVPFLKVMTKNLSENQVKYFLLLFFIFKILKSTITVFVYPYSTYVNAIVNRFNLDIFSGYIGYFVLGYYLANYELEPKKQKVLYGLGIASLVVCIVGNCLYSIHVKMPTSTFYDSFFITTFFVSCALFTFAKYQLSKIKLSDMTKNMIVKISNASFGIYLIHILWISILVNQFHFGPTTINPIFAVPIMAILVFIASLMSILVIKKIPFIHKYIT